MALNPRQQRFVEEYQVDGNGKQAAIRAGYSPRSAESTASSLLRLPKVGAAIRKVQNEQATRTEITADTILEALWSNHQRAIQAEPLVNKDGEVYGYRWEGNVSNKALELLGKTRSLFVERIEQSGPDGGPIEHRVGPAMTDSAKQRELLRLMPGTTEAA